MIIIFATAETKVIYDDGSPKGIPTDIVRRANRKLWQLDGATALDDLRLPSGNRLQKLHGNRAGRWSIRVNDQWRICFVWTDQDNASDVELVDYH